MITGTAFVLVEDFRTGNITLKKINDIQPNDLIIY